MARWRRDPELASQQMVFLRLLKEARLAAEMRQEDVAERLGVPQSYVSKVESGERAINVVEFRQYCLAIGASAVQFMERLDEALEHPENSFPKAAPRSS